jgi:hypothetical protein
LSTYSWSVPVDQVVTGQTFIKETDNKIQATVDDLVDFVNGEGNHLGQGLAFDLVDKLSAQTISGSKTFTSNINGNLVGDVTGNCSGNSATTTALVTPRDITVTGDVSGSVTFDGSSDVSMTATITALTGTISIWSGTELDVPSGWFVCNGLNGTPNLSASFVSDGVTTYPYIMKG